MLSLPLIVMAAVNETMRYRVGGGGYRFQGHQTINSDSVLADKCTWKCHNQTAYCKTNHVGLDAYLTRYTDIPYAGLIQILGDGSGKANSYYQFMNVLLLVLIVPCFIIVMLIRSWSMQDQIRARKQPHTQ